MKIKELRLKKDNELDKLLADEREKLLSFQFKVAQDQLKSVREVRKTKKIIAEILTLQREKKTNAS
ncbi:MAG TPA: 50S ribosomal protein L29 [bacterium]|nr:50S ribosomal protein L29 [bacterium]